MAKLDYYVIAADYAWIKPEGATVKWQPLVGNEVDWWRTVSEVWHKSEKRSAKVV